MKKTIWIFVLVLTIAACKKSEENKNNHSKKDSTEQKVSNQEDLKLGESEQKVVDNQSSNPIPPDYATLISGRWELKENNNFWAFYDKNKVYSDGNEQGTSYKIDVDKITYGSGGTAI